MRISDWSSDVCSSDLGYATNLCPHSRTPRLQWEAMTPSLMLRPAPVAERRWRVCRQVRANGRVRRELSQALRPQRPARLPALAPRFRATPLHARPRLGVAPGGEKGCRPVLAPWSHD